MLSALGAVAGEVYVYATTLTVTNLNDSGAGSLRDTIAAANNGDTINFAVTGTISLSDEIVFSKNLTISGPGANLLMVRPAVGQFRRVFRIDGGTSTFSDLTIAHGRRGGPGSGIYKSAGDLTLNSCLLDDNRTDFTSNGGGIYNEQGNLTLNGCALTGNSVPGASGGAIYSSDGTVALFGCTLSGNTATNGGGIFSRGPLVVTYSTFTNNTASPGGAALSGDGGAVYTFGVNGANATLTIDSCIFSNNAAFGPSGDGGAINVGGNSANSTGNISNSTFNDNSADNQGGAISNFSNNSLGGTPTVTLSVTNCTFSANKGASGGAIANTAASTSTATTTLTSCTFSRNGNSAGDGTTLLNRVLNTASAVLIVRSTILQKATGPAAVNFTNLGGTIVSDGYNIADDSPAGFLTGPADQVGLDPQLDPLGLQYNGGVIPTIALASGPAVDKGKNFGGLTTDQRGQPRTYDHPSFNNAVPGGDGTDIGAFEAQPDVVQNGTVSLFVNTLADHDDGICGAADCTLREAINRASALPGAQNIQFLANGTIMLDQPQGPLTVTTPVFINGSNARLLAVSGGNSTPVFNFSGGPSFLTGLTIRDGRSSAFFPTPVGGAGLVNSGTLTVTACAFVNNTAAAGFGADLCDAGGVAQGAGVYNANGGTLTFDRCLFNGNSATGGDGRECFSDFNTGGAGGAAQGGAIFNDTGATLTLSNCTLSGNTVTGGKGGDNTGGLGVGGSGGAGEGAGVFNRGTLNVRASTVARNTGTGGAGGLGSTPNRHGVPGASRGGITHNTGTATMRNSITALNTGATAPDLAGAFTSEGYNLIGIVSSATGLNATGDQVGTSGSPIDPLLGPLQNNGGPTDTLALLQNSPAIDKGKGFGLTTDQRDQPRPSDHPQISNAAGGDGADIGAFEVNFTLRITAISRLLSGNILLQGKGVPNAVITLRTSLQPGPPASFNFIGQPTVDFFGDWQFEDEGAAGLNRRFYTATYP